MESNNKLYFELCSEFKVTSKKTQQKLLKKLKQYKIYDKRSVSDISNLIGIFLEAKKSEGMSEHTLGNYYCTLKKFSEWLEANKIVTIDKNTIRSFITYINAGRKSTTTSQYLQRIKSFYNWCSGEDYVNNNPVSEVQFKKRKDQKHGLTADEVNRVRDACLSDRDKAMINFFLTTGCRVSEVCGLKKSDLNFDENFARVTGKGDKTRLVLFDDNTKELIKKSMSKSKNNEYVFSSSRAPYGKLERFAVEKRVRELGKKAELSYNLHPHLFRHTFATNCLENGMDLISIQKLLGHTDLSTTAVYAETSYKSIKEKYDKMFNEWLKIKRQLKLSFYSPYLFPSYKIRYTKCLILNIFYFGKLYFSK